VIVLKNKRFSAKALVCAALLTGLWGACIDLELPDLTSQWGTGSTDGPYCTPDQIEAHPPETLRIHVIDVGQGDALWIQTPWYTDLELESRNIIVDAGPAEASSILLDYLFTRGLTPGSAIDALVVTHAHADHYGGVFALVDNFDILRYVDPGYAASSTQFLEARNAALLEVVNFGGSPETPAIPGLASNLFQSVDLFGADVSSELLWGTEQPFGGPSDGSNSATNNTSIVLSLAYGGARVLLMGDAEEAVEKELVAQAVAGTISLKANVLKVGHHGSDSSSTPDFLSRVFPVPSANDFALISSGRKSFGGSQLPTDTTVNRLRGLLGTYHLLSTENRDETKGSGDAAGDDHIIITIDSNSQTEACYAP
jgi:competence protein ComEC